MNMNDISKAAKLLSSLQIGKPKNFSKAEIKRRTKILAEARKKRWLKNEDS